MGRRKRYDERTKALLRPFKKTWVPQPGQRVYLPIISRRLVNAGTGTIVRVDRYQVLVAYWPSYLQAKMCPMRFAKVPIRQTRPAPQLTSFEEQLTILEDMVRLSHGKDGVLAKRSGGASSKSVKRDC